MVGEDRVLQDDLLEELDEFIWQIGGHEGLYSHGDILGVLHNNPFLLASRHILLVLSKVYGGSPDKAEKKHLTQKLTKSFKQCCGSGMFIPDTGFWSFIHPGSRIQQQQQKRGKKICCPPFSLPKIYRNKIKNYLIIEQVYRNKIKPDTKNYTYR